MANDDVRHLLDLIRRVKPRVALFTTYTFSVGYFDAMFVPVLRSVGCQEIAVLVDAVEAKQSTKESRSRAAGRIYQVAPVVAPNGGVFHPKLAYLAGETEDVLSVGSGNLTASGQTFQLETFDAVSATDAPSVFAEFAEWLDTLAGLVSANSPQASSILRLTAPRARAASQREKAGDGTTLPPASLIHTLRGTPRKALEAAFLAGAEQAESIIVLSPFHSPDGGPLLRLASSLDARSLAVGLDASRVRLTAPFEAGRFEPKLPGRFVIPVSVRRRHRLHAKAFELRARKRVLVMTGSVNATAQSFESSKNVEVSLARWLGDSPFEWEDVVPEVYEWTPTEPPDGAASALYVDAYLEDDWTLRGRLTSRGALPTSIGLTITRGEAVLFAGQAELGESSTFIVGEVAAFDLTEAVLLTVTCGEASASCWLNIREQLSMSMAERERRAAVDRVLRGEYALEDIAEVIRLMTGIATGSKKPPEARAAAVVNEPGQTGTAVFSFKDWQMSGRHRGGVASLGRSPVEFLKAITAWLNGELAARQPNEPAVEDKTRPFPRLELRGGTDKEQERQKRRVDPHQLLDALCAAIPRTLERKERTEHAGVLAEVVASRIIARTLAQGLNMELCVGWLGAFSRYSYPEGARDGVSKVAAALACLVVHRMRTSGQEPELAVLRDAVERFSNGFVNQEGWDSLCRGGLDRDLFRRISEAERDALVRCAQSLATVDGLDETLLSLLRKGLTVRPNLIKREPEALTFPELAQAMQERRRSKVELIRGLMSPEILDATLVQCPFCYSGLAKDSVRALRAKHVFVHTAGYSCSNVLLLAAAGSSLRQGVLELPDA